MHVLDLHWYPEAQGGGDPKTGAGAKRITEGDNSPESIDARLQAPRSLWDPAYVEKSWITTYSTQKKPIQLLTWVKQKIDQRYPGTKLAFTEYDYGSGDHVSAEPQQKGSGLSEREISNVQHRMSNIKCKPPKGVTSSLEIGCWIFCGFSVNSLGGPSYALLLGNTP